MSDLWTLSEAIRAAGADETKVSVHRNRYPHLFVDALFPEQEDDSPRRVRVTRAGVYFIAIFSEMSRLGVPPRTASEAALEFCARPSGPPSRPRMPGELFDEDRGRTVIIVWRGFGHDDPVESVVQSERGFGFTVRALEPGADLFANMGGFPPRAVALVDVSSIVQQVDEALAKE